MATERLTMQKLREILRQKLERKRSHRDVARVDDRNRGCGGVALILSIRPPSRKLALPAA